MSGPAIPSPFEPLADRRFSFYPPIVNIEHNEFEFREATWSELLVVNTKTQQEIWIPRRFLSEVSKIEEPVMILGLNKELEFRSGQIVPHTRRVIEIPRPSGDAHAKSGTTQDAKTSSSTPMSLGHGTENHIGKLIGIVLAAGILICVLGIAFYRGGRDGSRVSYSTVLQSELPLAGTDDYLDVVRKIGKPASDQWRSDKGELQYRVLRYPDRNLAVILMGAERNKELYIGALDLGTWRPVHAVSLPNGGDTRSMLRSLQRF